MADICRCLHNFNGVLQICAAFTNSSVFRLKDTWKRVSKTVGRISFHFSLLQRCHYTSPQPPSPSCRVWSPATADTGTWGTPSTGKISTFVFLTIFPFGWTTTLLPHLQWFPIFHHSKSNTHIKSIPLRLYPLYPWHFTAGAIRPVCPTSGSISLTSPTLRRAPPTSPSRVWWTLPKWEW